MTQVHLTLKPKASQVFADPARFVIGRATLLSAATLRSLDRFRDALDRLPADADLNQTVELRLQDLALVALSMLSLLR